MSYYAREKGEKKGPKVRAGTVEERLRNRIVDGDKIGLQADLDEALKTYSALDVINKILLDGMKTVGDLFGSGQMQLPFVLQSAEVMKAAVSLLEPFMDKADVTSKGTMVIATVKGDVHDIGKNLVDIILTNNGFKVINLGIKCPIENILHTAQEQQVDAIGMSGLLVKSTLIMKENLEVMNERGITLPVVLGGAALTRRYVDDDLQQVFKGRVQYARDAFDGLRFMERIVSGEPMQLQAEEEEVVPTGAEAKIAMVSPPIGQIPSAVSASPAPGPGRSVFPAAVLPVPPFWGTKVVTDFSLEEVFRYVNEAALIRGQWQVKKGKLTGEVYQRLLEEKIYPEYSHLKSHISRHGLLTPMAVYGYFQCQSAGNDLIVFHDDGKTEQTRFTFPRQGADRHLCLSDYFAPVESGRMDVVAFHLVTMGEIASRHAEGLFKADNYKDYLYFHGLSVESAEALAELCHQRIRKELGIDGRDAKEIKRLFAQGYQGSRYSFGYPACPNLEDQAKLMSLLDGGRIGVQLSDEFQLVPEQSTTAIIVHHPEARYFTIK